MANRTAVVGVDFDNTIVCFDALFHRAACDQGLIPADGPSSKAAVRDFLRREGREAAWTELQGHVYGVMIEEAEPFAGVSQFFARCRERGLATCVISHKTRHPFAGPRHDLHAAARLWLEARGFFGPAIGLTPDRVHLELTKEAKLQRIARAGCGYFVDDLPEFLTEAGFPPGVERILFDPNGECPEPAHVRRAQSWDSVGTIVLS